MLQRLTKHGTAINTAKCILGVLSLSFLGHSISSAGVQPEQDKVEAVQRFPQSKNILQLREFLVLANPRFVLKCANILHPLHSLLAASGTNASAIQWNDQAIQGGSAMHNVGHLRCSYRSHIAPEVERNVVTNFLLQKIEPVQTTVQYLW